MDIENKLNKNGLTVNEIAIFMIDESYEKVIKDLQEMGELENFTSEDLDYLSDAIYNLVMG